VEANSSKAEEHWDWRKGPKLKASSIGKAARSGHEASSNGQQGIKQWGTRTAGTRAGKAASNRQERQQQQAGKAGSSRQERQEATGRKGRKHQAGKAGSIRQERRAEEGDLPAMPDMAGTEKGASPPGLL
jgi:hypothetical protein